MSYQRSLLEFANGKKEDHRTKYHIELAIANYAGQDKKSYEERIQWFQHNKDQIMDSLKDWDSILDPSSSGGNTRTWMIPSPSLPVQWSGGSCIY